MSYLEAAKRGMKKEASKNKSLAPSVSKKYVSHQSSEKELRQTITLTPMYIHVPDSKEWDKLREFKKFAEKHNYSYGYCPEKDDIIIDTGFFILAYKDYIDLNFQLS